MPGPTSSNPAPPAPSGGGSASLLLVEDEPTLRAPLAALLREEGFEVREAATAREAQVIWRTHAAGIDLLLTDMVLPDDLTGPELAARLCADKPALRVVYTSGYTPEMMREVFGLEGPVDFVQKPCAWSTLLAVVRGALQRSGKP